MDIRDAKSLGDIIGLILDGNQQAKDIWNDAVANEIDQEILAELRTKCPIEPTIRSMQRKQSEGDASLTQ